MRPRASKSPLVYMVIGVVALSLRAVLDDPWLLLALPGVAGLSYVCERSARARAVRARTPSAGGDPAWLGRVHPSSLWIWPDLPVHWWSPRSEGVPARIEVGDGGVTVARRRFGRSDLEPVRIPWTDIAGARSRDRGHLAPSGASFTTLRRADVTIDLVGVSANESALSAGQPIDSDGTRFRDGMDEPTRSMVSELIATECLDWRPGTAPLVFITAAPEGLVDLLLPRAAGPQPSGQAD